MRTTGMSAAISVDLKYCSILRQAAARCRRDTLISDLWWLGTWPRGEP